MGAYLHPCCKEVSHRKMAPETLYWDQASVLVQLGLLTAETLPISGVESARKVLDPTLPSNALIERAKASKLQ